MKPNNIKENDMNLSEENFAELYDKDVSLERKHKLLLELQQEAYLRINKLQEMYNTYKAMSKALSVEAIKKYKQQQMSDMVARFGDVDQVTPEMIEAFEKIQRREKHSCYHLQGVKVQEDDCNFCEKLKACQAGKYIHTVDPDLID